MYEITVTDAQDPVSYLVWDDGAKQLISGTCTEYTVIGPDTAEPGTGYILESGKWYVVKGTVNFANRIINNANAAPAHLILTDGCKFNVAKGINNEEGKSLCIYGQEGQSGELNITNPPRFDAGLGGGYVKSGGMLTIHGGIVQSTGIDGGAA